MATDEQRKMFEEYFSSRGMWRAMSNAKEQDAEGRYLDPKAQYEWEVWQAAIKSCGKINNYFDRAPRKSEGGLWSELPEEQLIIETLEDIPKDRAVRLLKVLVKHYNRGEGK